MAHSVQLDIALSYCTTMNDHCIHLFVTVVKFYIFISDNSIHLLVTTGVILLVTTGVILLVTTVVGFAMI